LHQGSRSEASEDENACCGAEAPLHSPRSTTRSPKASFFRTRSSKSHKALQAVADLLVLAENVEVREGLSLDASCRKAAMLFEASPCHQPLLLGDGAAGSGDASFHAASVSLMDRYRGALPRQEGQDIKDKPTPSVPADSPKKPCQAEKKSGRVRQGKHLHRNGQGGWKAAKREEGAPSSPQVGGFPALDNHQNSLDSLEDTWPVSAWTLRTVSQALPTLHKSLKEEASESKGCVLDCSPTETGEQGSGRVKCGNLELPKTQKPQLGQVVLKVPRLLLPVAGETLGSNAAFFH
jgi:hypothetical protein